MQTKMIETAIDKAPFYFNVYSLSPVAMRERARQWDERARTTDSATLRRRYAYAAAALRFRLYTVSL